MYVRNFFANKSVCLHWSRFTYTLLKLIYKCSKSENESIKNQHKCYLIISGAVTRRKGRRHYFFQNEKLCKFTSQWLVKLWSLLLRVKSIKKCLLNAWMLILKNYVPIINGNLEIYRMQVLVMQWNKWVYNTMFSYLAHTPFILSPNEPD